jgi:hypothetical protein
MSTNNDIIRIGSFDPGKCNFSFYIEEINKKELSKLKNVPLKEQYNSDGTCTDKMKELLDNIFENGETILHKNLNLTKNCDKKLSLDPETFHNMYDVMEEYEDEWNKCDTFIIEQQMSFGKGKNNPMAQKIGQHCYSYFVFKYGRTKNIVEFPAYHKTQVLGAPKVQGKPTKNGFRWKSMDKPSRKKWSICKSIEILTSRGEIEVLEGLTTVAKKDDLADTLMQLQAYKYLTFVR